MNYVFIIRDVFGEYVLRINDRGNIEWGGFNKIHTQKIATFMTQEEAEMQIELKKLNNAVIEKVYNLNLH